MSRDAKTSPKKVAGLRRETLKLKGSREHVTNILKESETSIKDVQKE